MDRKEAKLPTPQVHTHDFCSVTVLIYLLIIECSNHGIIASFQIKKKLSLTQSDQTSVNLQFQDYFTKHIFLHNRLLAAFPDKSTFKFILTCSK